MGPRELRAAGPGHSSELTKGDHHVTRGLGGDFPGGPVVKNMPCNAGDSSSTPDPGTKIPHAVGQLSLCTATTERLSCD